MANYIKADGNHKTVEVGVEVQLIKEGDYIVAYCPALNLSSYGDSEEDAKRAFDEALDIFFEETHARGTLERLLLDLGWGLRRVPHVQYIPPTPRNYSVKYPSTAQSKKIQELVLIPV